MISKSDSPDPRKPKPPPKGARLLEAEYLARLETETMRDFAVIILDADGRVAAWNSAAQHLFGYAADEILGRPVSRFYAAEDIHSGRPERDLQAAGHQGNFEDEQWRVRKDDSKFRAKISLTAVRDPGGALIGYANVTRALTDRYRAAEQFRLAIEAAPTGMLMVDRGGRIVLVNAQIERLFGYSREELIGNPIEMLVPERFRGRHPGHRHGFFANPSARPMGAGRDLYGLRKDGSEVPIEIGLNPLRTPEGDFVLSSVVDITERKRATEQFRLAIEAAPTGMLMVDRGGRIVLVNAQIEKLFGYSREDLIGESIDMLIPERFRGRHPEHRAGFFANPSARPMGAGRDLFGLRKDGTEIPVEIGLNPLRTSEGDFVLSSVVDITERKRAEAELRRLTETLEARVTERTALAEERSRQLSVVAAELIDAEQRERKRLAQVLHDDLAQNLALAKMRLNMTPASGPHSGELLDQTARVIGGMIDSARNIMHDLSPSLLYDVGLNAALEGLAERWRKLHGIRVSVKFTGGDQPLNDQLRTFAFRAIREALFNVAKHAKTEEARVTVDRGDPGRLRIEIADDGVGFDPAKLLHRGVPGDHFGLFSIRERAALLGGTFQVDSAPGAGTRVRLMLPTQWLKRAKEGPSKESRGHPKGATDVTTDTPKPESKVVRVLLADDHDLIREGLANLLARQPGIQVVGQAGHGQEAVELARSIRPDVIIMDVAMPKMSGLEATRIIHEELPGIRIVGLSMYEDKNVANSMLAAGASNYLSKGEDPNVLIAAIRGRPS